MNIHTEMKLSHGLPQGQLNGETFVLKEMEKLGVGNKKSLFINFRLQDHEDFEVTAHIQRKVIVLGLRIILRL